MGVRGLQSFLEGHCGGACYNINVGKLAEDYQKRTNKTPLIVVDGMSCLRKLYGKLVWICGGQWLGYIDHVRHFISSLQDHGIKLVFFFDGTTPERKRETWVHRRLENLKDVATYFNIIKLNKELEHGKHFFLPPGLAAFTPLVLKDVLGCEVFTCLEECDREVATYAKHHGAMGILGQDSDYTIYNTSHFYFSINHFNLETLDTVVYDRAALGRFLHLTIDQLPILSCLIGNDVIHQEDLAGFHKQFVKESGHGHHRYHSRPPPEVLIPKVAMFINNQPPMEQLMGQLPQLARAVFRDETMAVELAEGIKMYQLNMSGMEKYVQLSEEEMMKLDVMERVQQRHIQSELGRHLYTIVRGESYESSTTLEDYTSSLPSGALIFRPLRSRVYRIIQKFTKDQFEHVTEWCMYSGNMLKEPDVVEPEELLGGSPSLDELWNGDDDLKWRTMLDCIHPELHDTQIRTLPPHLVTPVSILFYMQCSHTRPVLKDWEVNALIAAFLSPIRADLNQIRSVGLPRIDARAVHVATLFMKGVVNMYLLIGACGFPLKRTDAVPWAFWDGKVFQHMYLKAKAGARIDDLCEHKDDLLKLFVEVKNLVASHTPSLTPSKQPDGSPHGSPRKHYSQGRGTPETATPPASPTHPPTTLAINKSTSGGMQSASPSISPTSPRSPYAGKHSLGNKGKGSKSPSKSPVPKSPKQGSS